MFEYYFILIIVGVLVLGKFYLYFKHTPRITLPSEVKEKVMNQGLVHYTTIEKAHDIMLNGIRDGLAKTMVSSEKDMVWMYINELSEHKQQIEVIKRKRKKSNAAVIIKGVTEEQIRNMRYRKNDMAIVHIGDFKTNDMSIETLYD